MNWYSVTVNYDKAKSSRKNVYVQAQDEKDVKEVSKEYMSENMGLTGINSITINCEMEGDEQKIKNLVIGGEFNGMIYNEGTYLSKGNLKSGF